VNTGDMGADISFPEDNQAELTSEAVVGLIGQSYFDQTKWKEVTGEANVITVEALRNLINQHSKDDAEGKDNVESDDGGGGGGGDEGGQLRQESTMDLEGDTRTHEDSMTRDSDDDDDATGEQMTMGESSLLQDSTKDVDDFSVLPSISVNRVVMKLPPDEFAEKHRRLKIVYQAVRESRVGGVISRAMKERVVELRELLTTYYDQTGDFFITKNKKEKMLIFIAEYYYLIDHFPKGRDFMRFYSRGSKLKIAGLHKFPDIEDAKPIGIALLVGAC
jgi:hypothetical protein